MDSPDTTQEEDSVFGEDGDETKSSTDKDCQQETEHDSTETKDENQTDSHCDCDTQRDRDSGTFSMGNETPTESSGSLSQLDSLSQRMQKMEQDMANMARQNEMMKAMLMQQSFLRLSSVAIEAAWQEHQKIASLMCSGSSLNWQPTSSCGAPPAPPPPPPDAAPDFTSSPTPRIKSDVEKNLSKNGVSVNTGFVGELTKELERRRQSQGRRMTFCAVTEHSASTETADNLKRTNSTGDLRQEDGEEEPKKNFRDELLEAVKYRRSSVDYGKIFTANGELRKPDTVIEDPEQESET